MRGHSYRLLFLFVFSLSIQPALAQDPRSVINGAELEQKANSIIQSEPGASEVTVRVEVDPVNDGKKVVDLNSFDVNKDGIFDHEEVGEHLFTIFDADNNRVIDNIEMVKPRLLVFTNMEKKTIERVNYQDPSKPTKEVVSTEQFLQQSNLSKFDTDKDGLSPLDFVEKTFLEVNVHKDGVIDLYEWKRAYASSIRPLHIEDFNYNN